MYRFHFERSREEPEKFSSQITWKPLMGSEAVAMAGVISDVSAMAAESRVGSVEYMMKKM